MAKTVNLDAMIPREDFLTDEGPTHGSSDKTSVTHTDLRIGDTFYSGLRKPDFQRETAAWTPEHVLDLVQSYIEEDLIPSVICWQSPARLSFIIDGAHRVSAIIAWILDDYGDKDTSIKYYNNRIPEEQKKIAEKTRRLINSRVGSYTEVLAARDNPDTNPRLDEYARALPHAGLQLQWLKKSEAKKAEQAFFKINQSAVKIDATELKILDTRFKPNAVLARAVVRNAAGHKYWGTFSPDGIKKLDKLAQEINKELFSPPLETPVKTLELPMAGHGYGAQSLPLIYELANMANGIPVVDPARHKTERGKNRAAPDKSADSENEKDATPMEKVDESETIKQTMRTLKLVRRMTSNHSSSLGLHPAIYYYSAAGRHQPTSVLAMAAIVMDMEKRNSFNSFTSIRSDFEEFLLDHKYHVNQITAKYGSMAKGYAQVKKYFEYVINTFAEGKSREDLEEELSDHHKYSTFLRTPKPSVPMRSTASKGKKQLAFLDEALEAAITCNICGARKDVNSMTVDHIIDKKDGGKAEPSNLEYVHPYCNSAYKEYIKAKTPKPQPA